MLAMHTTIQINCMIHGVPVMPLH